MTPDCRPYREWIGAHALGHLPPGDETQLLAHLDRCPSCAAEAAEVAEVAALLPAAQPAHLDDAPPLPPGLDERVVRQVARARVRRRWTVAGAGLAAAAAVVALLLLLPSGGDSGGVEIAFDDAPRGVAASAVLDARPWGTAISLDASGLDRGVLYQVWVRLPDESRVPAGTFRGTGSAVRVSLATGLSPSEYVGVGISVAGGDTVLYAHLD